MQTSWKKRKSQIFKTHQIIETLFQLKTLRNISETKQAQKKRPRQESNQMFIFRDSRHPHVFLAPFLISLMRVFKAIVLTTKLRNDAIHSLNYCEAWR